MHAHAAKEWNVGACTSILGVKEWDVDAHLGSCAPSSCCLSLMIGCERMGHLCMHMLQKNEMLVHVHDLCLCMIGCERMGRWCMHMQLKNGTLVHTQPFC